MRWLPAIAVLVIAYPALAEVEYAQRETAHFLFEYAAADEKTAAYLADHAEKIREDVTYLIGFDFKARTTVRIAPDLQTYQHTQPRVIVPEWSVGAAFPAENLIVLLSPSAALEDGRNLEPLQIFKHEVSHVVLGRALAGRSTPRWLDEGIAEHLSEPWNSRKTFRMTLAVLTGRKIPLSRLVRSWPKDRDGARIAYLESQAFVDFLFRHGAVHKVVDALRRRESVEEAVASATGIPVRDLNTEFDDFLTRNYTWVHLFIEGDVVWGFASFLFILTVIISAIKSRRRLRRMELEDELEDPGGAGRPRRRRPRRGRRNREELDFDDWYN
ncbi:MAG: hypothetical protein M5R36_19840 [Deltaproteobacteria bacterium]|nr:hypothetical protein [Deltaproteobacteria bacterium]